MSDANVSAKPRRRWLWVLGGIVALILLVALIAPLFINAESLRTQIASAIESSTGRKATVGPIHVRILPSAAAVIDGFQISNPPGFAGGNLMTMDSFRAGLALGDLLHGNIHVTSVELVHPTVTLIEDENGHDNYTFTVPAAKAPASGSSSSSFSLSAIDNVTLSDAMVSLAVIPKPGAQPFTMAQLSHLTLHLGHVVPDMAHIKEWQGDANLKGLTVALGALKGPVNFSDGTAKLANGALDLTFDAQAGKVTALKGSMHIPDLTNPVTKFDISTPSFDADALLASLQQTPKIPAAKKSSSSASLSSALVAQGHIVAQQIVWSPYTGGNAAADVRIFGDHTEVWPASMTLYGGSLQISARTDAKQTPTRFTANVKLQSLDIARMLAQGPAGLRGKMAGLAQIDLELAGASSGNWAKDLSGHGNFAVRDGKLPGVNLAGSLGVLAKAAGVNETPFKSITGDLVIGGGLVTTKTTHMDSPDGTVDLAGSYSLVNDSLDYTGKAVVTPGGAGLAGQALTSVIGAALKTNVSTMTVPFTIKGTTANPQFRPGAPTVGAGQQQKQATPTDALTSGLQKLFKKH